MTFALRCGLLLGAVLVSTAHAQEVRISRSDCRFLDAYREGGADYQPGVSVDGKAVAPADLTPPLDIGSTIVIALKADLMREFGIRPSSPLLEPEAHLGVIVVRGDQVFFNGQPLGDAEKRCLARECLEKRGGE